MNDLKVKAKTNQEDTEASLAYSIFWATKGNVRPEEFYAMDMPRKAFYIAMLEQYAEDNKNITRR